MRADAAPIGLAVLVEEILEYVRARALPAPEARAPLALAPSDDRDKLPLER